MGEACRPCALYPEEGYLAICPGSGAKICQMHSRCSNFTFKNDNLPPKSQLHAVSLSDDNDTEIGVAFG